MFVCMCVCVVLWLDTEQLWTLDTTHWLSWSPLYLVASSPLFSLSVQTCKKSRNRSINLLVLILREWQTLFHPQSRPQLSESGENPVLPSTEDFQYVCQGKSQKVHPNAVTCFRWKWYRSCAQRLPPFSKLALGTPKPYISGWKDSVSSGIEAWLSFWKTSF